MSLVSALKRSVPLVLACVLVCAAVGVAVGLLRDAEYESEAKLFVGSLDVRTLAIPGYVLASQQLADAYSRLVVSDAIEVRVARRLRLSPEQVSEHLSAANIPQSPVLRIRATGSSADDAVKLARAATAQTTRYATRLTTRSAEAGELFKRYRTAVRRAQALEARAALLRARGAPERARVDAQTVAETARLNAATLGQLYGQARGTSAGGAQLRVIDPGRSASSDRGEVIQRLLLLGVASGFVLGAALATLRWQQVLRQQ